MEFDTIFFIGPQGSGKGTQAKFLADGLGFFYWEMGGILREVAGQDSELGRTVADLINRGVLLNDDLLLSVVKAKLSEIPPDKGVIFDGVPRRLGQAQFLLDQLRQLGRNRMLTVFIDLPREESIKRLLLRAQKQGRKDDTQKAIEFRLQQYEQDTIPVLEYLKQKTTFITIDGQPSIDKVTAEINKALNI